jgi:hypothetical protein
MRALGQELGLQNRCLHRAENYALITRTLLVLLFAASFGAWFGAWFWKCTVTQVNNGLRWKGVIVGSMLVPVSVDFSQS